MKQRTYLKRKLARPATAESKYKLSDFVSFVALVLTLATALFYYLGYIYYSAYLSYWGLPEAIFSLSREQSIISGLFAYAIIWETCGVRIDFWTFVSGHGVGAGFQDAKLELP